MRSESRPVGQIRSTEPRRRPHIAVRNIKLAKAAGGFGVQLNEMHAWLDENCSTDGWAMTRCGRSRDCGLLPKRDLGGGLRLPLVVGEQVEVSDGAFRLREDQQARRVVTPSPKHSE
jgi:hypothetical protein